VIEVLRHLWRGRWSCGCAFWPGKPMLYAGRTYYDGWHYVAHVGPFWLECAP